MKRSSLAMTTGIVLSLSLFFFLTSAEGQKVRLRSKLNPECGTTVNKFADIWADGNVAVMGSFTCRGAFIFDVSNPDAPVLSSWYDPSPRQAFLEAIVIGNRAYFGSGGTSPSGSPSTGDGIHIVDLTDPEKPVLLGKVNGSNGGFNGIHEMVVFDQGDRRFLIANYNSFADKILKVIDVSNPAAPFFVRDIAPTEIAWVHAMHIRGNRMYTSGWGTSSTRGRTEIYDITNIGSQAPTLLGFIQDASASVTAGNNMHSSWTSEDGNFLYSAREVGGSAANGPNPGDVRVYDVSNAASPLLVNRVTMADLGLNAVTPHNPVVMGSKLYVSWYQAGLQLFDISVPGALNRIGQYDTYPPAYFEPEGAASVSEASWEVMCGRDNLQNSLPTTFNGTWAVFPFLGEDRVLVGEMNEGLMIVDVTGANRPKKNVVSDFDGDGRTDLSHYSTNDGQWLWLPSGAGGFQNTYWGLPDDIPVAGDYDGDGRSDPAVFRSSNGVWYIRGSRGEDLYIPWGVAGDIPVSGDFDADGRADAAVFRPSNGVWYINQSTLGFKALYWGVSTDKPVTGDFDGDGKSDIAVYRPGSGVWYIYPSSTSIPMFVYWGVSEDKPISADFDGDGRTEIAVYRPSVGDWYILSLATGGYTTYRWGVSEDIPVPADYDGDERSDVTVYRPSNRMWYRVNSTDGSYSFSHFGGDVDVPSPSSVNPR